MLMKTVLDGTQSATETTMHDRGGGECQIHSTEADTDVKKRPQFCSSENTYVDLM